MEQPPSPELEQYQKLLDVVEAHMVQLTQVPLEERLKTLSDIERAEYKTVLAYAITTLQLCYLRTKGDNVEGHTNMRHLERIRNFFTKIYRYADASSK
ncbi:hypothetical protein M9Y10_041142 [Tritrichomonas musculus]|uniref:Nuclear nucleic acid-binding protein C1D n=1 Tax=Tritrichomonas musculus TaxID=1915356 RepID=A0ABR2K3I3_9EUKA